MKFIKIGEHKHGECKWLNVEKIRQINTVHYRGNEWHVDATFDDGKSCLVWITLGKDAALAAANELVDKLNGVTANEKN